MSTYGLYVGNPDDPKFHWDSEKDTLLPEDICNLGLTWNNDNGVHHFCEARDVLEHRDFGGKPLDWGSYGAMVDKDGIRQFLQRFPQYPNWVQHNLLKLDELPDKNRYVIVAYEY